MTVFIVLLSFIAQSTAVAYQQVAQIAKLNIEILEGDGAVNNIRQRVAREPIVQVTDENRKPIAGASVVFLLPNQGAGATFANGSRTLTVLTNNQGQAVARGIQANRLAGEYQMRVSASFQGQTASTSITMSNVAAAGAAAAGGLGAMKWLLIIGAVGGAAVGTAVVVNNGGSNTPARTPTTISVGSPTVGAPR